MNPIRCAPLACVLAVAALAAAGDESNGLRDDLAGMIQQVARQTHISMNMRETAATHIRIDKVNGRSVCAPDAKADVERLQQAFDAQPGIYRNIGPALIHITDGAGQRSVFDREIALVGGVIPACYSVYISVHD